MMRVKIWTDGSADNFDHSRGGWAAVLVYENQAKIVGGFEKVSTNNRMEAEAVVGALLALKKPCHVQLYTDSQYVVYGLQRLMRHSILKTNQDIWQRAVEAMKPHQVEIVKVLGHNGDVMNELADQWAAYCGKNQRKVAMHVEDLASYLKVGER